MIILGISGKAGVGKDTAADYLVDNYGFVKIAFADVIKRICKDVFDFSEDQLWGVSGNRNKVDERYTASKLTPRKTLQSFGDCGRELYSNIWLEFTLNMAKRLNTEHNIDYEKMVGIIEIKDSKPKHVVISDLRYFNEVKATKNYGGLVTRILRPEVGDLSGAAGQHSSESNQKFMNDEDFDVVLNNSNTIPDLYRNIDQFIKSHL